MARSFLPWRSISMGVAVGGSSSTKNGLSLKGCTPRSLRAWRASLYSVACVTCSVPASQGEKAPSPSTST